MSSSCRPGITTNPDQGNLLECILWVLCYRARTHRKMPQRTTQRCSQNLGTGIAPEWCGETGQNHYLHQFLAAPPSAGGSAAASAGERILRSHHEDQESMPWEIADGMRPVRHIGASRPEASTWA